MAISPENSRPFGRLISSAISLAHKGRSYASLAAAAAGVAAAVIAAAVATAATGHQAVPIAAAAEQQNQNDNPPTAIVTHKRYLQKNLKQLTCSFQDIPEPEKCAN